VSASGQLALDLDVASVAPVPRPAGLRVIELNGVRFLFDVGDDDPRRVNGWYYGYPACCVEAFIQRPRHSRGRLLLHPVSGHVLCFVCAAGPLAPLPTRPAERYGFGRWNDAESEPYFELPSTYDPPGRSDGWPDVSDLLAADLARVLDAEPFGLACDELAKRVHRRRADVLAALRADPRFEQHGRLHGSRWQLTERVGRGRNGTGDRGDGVPWLGLDPSGIPVVGREPESA
jgi:hypothetical protein